MSGEVRRSALSDLDLDACASASNSARGNSPARKIVVEKRTLGRHASPNVEADEEEVARPRKKRHGSSSLGGSPSSKGSANDPQVRASIE